MHWRWGGGISIDTQNISDIGSYDHDSVPPTDVFHVVDADSSQQDAVLCASRDVSFVLQGPPGTGKSQTITNIIASKLADGKKVLFVSEKQAALDVVYKRLKDVGLSDFVLTLHSNKANKKETLSQLEEVLTLSRKKVEIVDSIQYKLDKLVENRKKLNTYAKEVNAIISPLNKNIFYANGEISKYSDIEDVSFQIQNIRQTTEKQHRDYISVLDEVARHVSKMNDDCSSNPWRNTTIPLVTNEFIHDFGERKEKIVSGITKFNEIADNLIKDDKLTVTKDLKGIKNIHQLLDLAEKSPNIPIKWIEGDNISLLKNYINEESVRCKEYEKVLNNLIKRVNFYNNFNKTSICEFNKFETTAEASKVYDVVLEKFKNNLFSNTNAFKSDVNSIDFVTKNESITKDYIVLNKKITDEYYEDIFSIDIDDCKSIEMRFKYNYVSRLRILKPSYWSDKKRVTQFAKNPKEKRTNQDIICLLGNIIHRNELLENIKELKSKIHEIYPKLYNDLDTLLKNSQKRFAIDPNLDKDLDTDFDSLKKESQNSKLLYNSLVYLSQLYKILSNLEQHETDISNLIENRYLGIKTDWEEVRKALDWVESFLDAIASYSGEIKRNDSFVVRTFTEREYVQRLHDLNEKIKKDISIYIDSFHWFAEKFDNKDEILNYSFDKLKSKLMDCNIDSLQDWIDYRSVKKQVAELGLTEYLNIIENRPIESAKIVPIFEKRFYRLWLDSVFPEFPAVASFRHVNHESIIKEFSDLDRQQLDIARARIKAMIINSLPTLDTFTTGEVNILKRELLKQRKIMPIRKLFTKIPNLLMTLKPCLMMSPLSVSQFLESDCYQFDTVIFDEASQVKTENAIGSIFRGKQLIIAGDKNQLPPTTFFEAQSEDSDSDSDEEGENETLPSILEEAIKMSFPSQTLRWHYRSRHEHLIAFSNSEIYRNELVTFPSNTDKLPGWGVEYICVENGYYNGKGYPRGNPIEAERVAKEVFKHFKQYPNRTLGVITFGVVQEFAIEAAINKLRKEHPEYEEFFVEDKPEAFFVKSLENVQGDERDTIIFSIGYAKDAAGKMAMRFGPLSRNGGERRLNVAITRAKYNLKLIGSIKPMDIDTVRVSSDGPKLLRKYIEFAMNGPEVLLAETKESDRLEFDSPFESSVYFFLESKGYKVATQVGCSGYRIDLAIKHPNISGVYVLGIECDGATYHSSRTARERDRLRQDVLEMMGWKFYRIWSTDWIKDTEAEKQRLLTAIENAIATFKPEILDVSSKTVSKKKENKNEFLVTENKPVINEQGYGFKEYAPYIPPKINVEYDRQSLAKHIIKTVEIEQPVHFDVVCQRLCGIIGRRQKVTSVVQKMISLSMRLINTQIEKKDNFMYLSNSSTEYDVRLAGTRQIQYIAIDELAKGMLKIIDSNIGITKDELFHETSRAFGFNRTGNSITERLNKTLLFLEDSKKVIEKDDKVLKVENT